MAIEEVSKLQRQHSELKLYLKSKQEELVAATERKAYMEKKLSEIEKVHATEMQQTKADLTRQVNKLNRQVSLFLFSKASRLSL